MRKIICLIFAGLMAVSASAFNFVGKTFRGSSELDDGSVATITYVFRANNKLTSTLAQTGKRTQMYSNLMWEVSGEYINIYEPATGGVSYLGIEQDCDDHGDCDGVILVGYDSWGNEAMYFDEVKKPAAKKSGKKSKRK